MLQHFDQARLQNAYEDAKRTDTDAVVVAIARDNGQVVIYNIGDLEGRNGIYDTISTSGNVSLRDLNARITLTKKGEGE